MKRKFITITDFLSISDDNRFAKVDLRASIPNTEPDEVSAKALQAASLAWWEVKGGKPVDNVTVPDGELVLNDERYVYKEFRALSQVFLKNRGLDFSRPGVLQASVDLLKGKTIYANHDFRDIDNWRGVVAEAVWDAKGELSGNMPGINVKTKVDAFLNYRTACGLMMTPPAINAASVTVVAEVEFSHPELVKDGTFWNKFLEEVDGEIVRLIAVNIVEYWEMSFVFLGEDRLAKSLPSAEPEDEETQTGARKKKSMAASELNATEKTEKTMILTKEQKELLGITAEGDDVPEQTVLDAALAVAKTGKLSVTEIADLSSRAKAGDKLIAEKRDEVIRLAKLVELGAEEGELTAVINGMIEKATADELVELEAHYRKKVSDKFPKNKSSLENTEEIEDAGGVGKTEGKQVNVNSLH